MAMPKTILYEQCADCGALAPPGDRYCKLCGLKRALAATSEKLFEALREIRRLKAMVRRANKTAIKKG